jgi:phosphoserine phosphatase
VLPVASVNNRNVNLSDNCVNFHPPNFHRPPTLARPNAAGRSKAFALLPARHLFTACLSTALCLWAVAARSANDSLPSWNDGAAKRGILAFVADVTRPGAPTFVPPPERIAVFDNDGTLWTEQPSYTQFAFAMDRVKAVADQHPDWNTREPFKAALAANLKGVVASGVHGLIELPAAACAGLTVEEYDRVARDWLATARHPRFGRPYTECVYQPMLELLAYLRANGFKTYVVSGGSLEFMRPWTERVYGIPPEQLIGSTVVTKLEVRDGRPLIVRQAEIELINDKNEKPLSIQRIIGRRPVFAFGNSDGDLPMLQWTAAGEGRRFCGYVHHTDGEREYAYDRTASTGRLDKGLDEAKAQGWTVVDMKADWRRVFPF